MTEKKIEFKLSKKRIILALLLMLPAFAAELMFEGSMLKFVLCVCAMFGFGGLLNVTLRGAAAWIVMLFAAFAAAAADVLVVQMINGYTELLPKKELLLGAAVALSVIFFVYLIVLLVLPRRDAGHERKAIIIASVLLVFLAAANYYTFLFRGRAMAPNDFLSLGTAANVVGDYSFTFPVRMQQALLLFAALVFILSGIKTENMPRLGGRRVFALGAFAALAVFLHFALATVQVRHWENEGCRFNGLLLNFAGQIQQSVTRPPDGYSGAWISQQEQTYAPENVGEVKKPHVIAIMNESFADMRVWGEFGYEGEMMPFLDSLEENAIKGYALCSVLGGTTADSEYEFITGNTMGFHSPSALPFQQYVNRDMYTLERYLESLGYDSYFTHPAVPENWNRGVVYPYLGFEDTEYIEAYEGCDTVRIFPSDKAVYDKLIERFDSRKADGPQFLFSVTIQNHSPYVLWSDFSEEESVKFSDADIAEADQYFSCVRASDSALRYLVERFRQEEEPVVILMFGDHQPNLPEGFLQTVAGSAENLPYGTMSQYIVPFFVWANYDIEEEYVELTSLNYLSNYLLEAAGIPLSPYNKFLKDVQSVIPAMNAYGYWSRSRDAFVDYDEAEGQEQTVLQAYEAMQYNAVFDRNRCSKVFFPIN